jgi:hypothetical protein
MTIRRLAFLGSLAVALVAFGVSPAIADELSEYLEDADAAAYSGTRLVSTSWDGIESMGIMEVQHVGGLTMVGSGQSYTMVGHGKVRAVGSSGVSIEYANRSELPVAHGYVLTHGGMAVRAGRPISVIEVHEGELLRMRMKVDAATRAPLETEVYDDEGAVFRYSTMVEFSPETPDIDDYVDDGEYYMMLPLEQAQLPGELGRYQLVDAYSGPGDAEQGFYSDGLFRHSLFTISGRASLKTLAPDGQTWMLDGFTYVRMVTPTEVWVFWNSPDATYALVGDLPPDHIEAVLAELPRPGQRNWFSRMWQRLFG